MPEIHMSCEIFWPAFKRKDALSVIPTMEMVTFGEEGVSERASVAALIDARRRTETKRRASKIGDIRSPSGHTITGEVK